MKKFYFILSFLFVTGCNFYVDSDTYLLFNHVKDPSGNEVNCLSFSVSPDGKTIALARYNFSSDYSDHSGYLSTLSSDFTTYNNTAIPANNVSWSSDGSEIYFDDGTNIYSVNSDGTNKTLITISGTGSKTYPRPSPDGKYLGFINSGKNICLLNFADSSIKILTNNSNFKTFSWMSDSSSIIYDESTSYFDDGSHFRRSIYLISGVESVSPVTKFITEGAEPSFLSDGRIIHSTGLFNIDKKENLELLPGLAVHEPVIIEGTQPKLFYIRQRKNTRAYIWEKRLFFSQLEDLENPLYLGEVSAWFDKDYFEPY